jgi:hypothetical protein
MASLLLGQNNLVSLLEGNQFPSGAFEEVRASSCPRGCAAVQPDCRLAVTRFFDSRFRSWA